MEARGTEPVVLPRVAAKCCEPALTSRLSSSPLRRGPISPRDAVRSPMDMAGGGRHRPASRTARLRQAAAHGCAMGPRRFGRGRQREGAPAAACSDSGLSPRLSSSPLRRGPISPRDAWRSPMSMTGSGRHRPAYRSARLHRPAAHGFAMGPRRFGRGRQREAAAAPCAELGLPLFLSSSPLRRGPISPRGARRFPTDMAGSGRQRPASRSAHLRRVAAHGIAMGPRRFGRGRQHEGALAAQCSGSGLSLPLSSSPLWRGPISPRDAGRSPMGVAGPGRQRPASRSAHPRRPAAHGTAMGPRRFGRGRQREGARAALGLIRNMTGGARRAEGDSLVKRHAWPDRTPTRIESPVA